MTVAELELLAQQHLRKVIPRVREGEERLLGKEPRRPNSVSQLRTAWLMHKMRRTKHSFYHFLERLCFIWTILLWQAPAFVLTE